MRSEALDRLTENYGRLVDYLESTANCGSMRLRQRLSKQSRTGIIALDGQLSMDSRRGRAHGAPHQANSGS